MRAHSSVAASELGIGGAGVLAERGRRPAVDEGGELVVAAALGGVDGVLAGGVLLAAVGAVLEQDAAGFAEAGRRRQVERGGPVGGGGVDLDAALEDRGGALRPVVVPAIVMPDVKLAVPMSTAEGGPGVQQIVIAPPRNFVRQQSSRLQEAAAQNPMKSLVMNMLLTSLLTALVPLVIVF